MNIERKVRALLEERTLIVKSTSEGETLLHIDTREDVWEISLSNKQLVHKKLKRLWYVIYNERISDKQIDEVVEILEIEGFNNPLKEERVNRIYNECNCLIGYQLDKRNSVWMDADNQTISIEPNPPFIFHQNGNFEAQTYPNLKIKPKMLKKYVRKHFGLRNKDDEQRLMLFLVSCYFGMDINHPLLAICSEKGGGKSVLMKMLELLIDPKKSGLCALPKSSDGLMLRLNNSYFTCFDNVSWLSQPVSDTLCLAVTGASDSDRALYQNMQERIANLHSIVALTSIGMVIKAPDLLDRTQLLRLRRLEPSEIRTEEEIWRNFEIDRPKIMGAIFNTVFEVLMDDEPVELDRMIRLADYHVLTVKIGRVLGISQDRVTRLLFENKSELNQEAIESSPTALAIVELMKREEKFEGTPTECLSELRGIAKEIGLDSYALPKTPAQLTNQLQKVKSELESTFCITFERTRGKERKYIIRTSVLE